MNDECIRIYGRKQRISQIEFYLIKLQKKTKEII